MRVDVVCVGDPFLDLIFLGLPAMPALGEERLAQRLKIVPGGMGNVAFALRRLGLDAVICGPVGRDLAGRLLEELMADVGVPWHGRTADATPVTVALPVHGDRALVSVMPALTVDTETLRGIEMRAVVVDLPNVPLLPPIPRIYAVVGDPEVAALEGRLPDSLADVHALVLNEREAMGLTRRSDGEAAAAHLAALGTTVVMTRGGAGAVAIEPDGQTTVVAAPPAAVHDATGAGDLFVSAYVWADLAGRPIAERLRLATRYASLSLERATDQLKGIPLADFLDEIGG
ncbi:MAG TPA: PfkB family carbohydrate kinase [Candidatus Limnocylindrales bacterium]|nr:PfkB family carbohydrate kinase [Candidatus Limnocylindrales bacterium]